MNITYADLLYSSGAIIGMISFTIRDILWLRAIYVMATIIYIISATYFGVLIMVFWNSLTLSINVFQIIMLILERYPIMLPVHLKDIYLQTFDSMKPKEFLYFYKFSKKIHANNQIIIKQGALINEVFFIVSGTLIIKKNDTDVIYLNKGAFIGEMNFLTGSPTSTSVFADTEVELLTWKKSDLIKLKSQKPEIYMKFQSILGVDLVNKLLATTDSIIDMRSLSK